MPQQGYGYGGGMPPQQAAGPCTIRVRVISASGLQAMDANGKADPYVILRFDGEPKPFTKGDKSDLGGKKSKSGKNKAGKMKNPQTNVQKKTLSPHWNQTFDITLPGPPRPTNILTLELYDYDSVGLHDFMGSAHVEMGGLNMGQERVGTYKVFSKKGKVEVAVTAMNFSCPPPGQLEGNMNANKQMAAENARKRAQYKKQKKSHDMKKDIGKGAKKTLKSIGKMF